MKPLLRPPVLNLLGAKGPMGEIIRGNTVLQEAVNVACARQVRVMVGSKTKRQEFIDAVFALFGFFPIHLRVVLPK